MKDTTHILLRLLEATRELEALLGAAWPGVQKELVDLIFRSDTEGQTASFQKDVDAFLGKLLGSPAATRVREWIRDVPTEPEESVTRLGGILGGVLGGKEERAIPTVVIPVFYSTDREARAGPSVEERFSGERGTLVFGVAHVSIPPGHIKGEVEMPKWWQFRPDPTKHVVLHDIHELEQPDFVAKLKKAMATADSRDALVYVHGYNVTFADATRRTAQIAHDLKFPGRTLLYSWPSKGGKLGYAGDEATIEWSRPHFEQFLRMALTEIGAGTVHVLAHSMGNRALARTLEHFDTCTLPVGSARLRQIIFAAPDIDRDVFLQLAEKFSVDDARVTLYASDNDVALKLSKTLHRGPRAGEAGESLVVIAGVDTVDASEADTSLFGLGHSYYATKRSVLSDLFNLLKVGAPPDERFGLSAQQSPAGRYWRFEP